MIAIARAAAEHPHLKHKRLDFVFGGRRPEDMCGEDLLGELPAFGGLCITIRPFQRMFPLKNGQGCVVLYTMLHCSYLEKNCATRKFTSPVRH